MVTNWPPAGAFHPLSCETLQLAALVLVKPTTLPFDTTKFSSGMQLNHVVGRPALRMVRPHTVSMLELPMLEDGPHQ
jgi:hypothetical protein